MHTDEILDYGQRIVKLGLRGKGVFGSTIQKVFSLIEVGGLFHR